MPQATARDRAETTHTHHEVVPGGAGPSRETGSFLNILTSYLNLDLDLYLYLCLYLCLYLDLDLDLCTCSCTCRQLGTACGAKSFEVLRCQCCLL